MCGYFHRFLLAGHREKWMESEGEKVKFPGDGSLFQAFKSFLRKDFKVLLETSACNGFYGDNAAVKLSQIGIKRLIIAAGATQVISRLSKTKKSDRMMMYLWNYAEVDVAHHDSGKSIPGFAEMASKAKVAFPQCSTLTLPLQEDEEGLFDSIVPPLDQELPGYLLVVHDKVLLANPRIYQKLKSCLERAETLEVYSLSTTRTPEFQDRFPIRKDPNFRFIDGELYRQHPLDEDRYLPLSTYQRTIDDETMNEALYMLNDLGAKVIEVVSSSSSKVEMENDREVTLSVPEVVPIPAVAVGMQFPQVQRLVPEIQEQRRHDEVILSFSRSNEVISQNALKIEVASVVGIAYKETHSTLSEFEYSFNVKFYDESAFKEVREWEVSSSSSRKARARESLSNLASQRAQHWPQRLSFREDLRLPGEGTVPIEEWLQCYDGIDTMPELFRAQELSNVLYVPLVLYGPMGYDNTSVLFTWQFAVTRYVGTLHEHGAWAMWDKLVGADEGRGQRRKKYQTFMQNVRFAPRACSVAEFATGDGGVDNAEQYAQLSEKDVVKLLVWDTPDAKTLDRDVEGLQFPFGLRILVLDGNMVNYLRKERDAREAGESGELTDQEYAELEERWTKTFELVGPERPPASDGEPLVIGLDHYPPIACVLRFSSEPVEDVPKLDERADCVAIVKSELGITRVWPLLVLQAPDTEEEAEELTEYYSENARELMERVKRLEKVASEAVGVLDKLFQFITKVEFKLRMQAERAEEADARKETP
ncbi:Hypothetical Protein FCC1311_110092 [Hondaea fermentalgiana]|uniref:Uncharacterized protein n=1 Tax=Hondaea fermentalgiana TaxID=2315210 RepID=A0A2R5GVB8_9STRA|nr:Hypothetical Protein FCC1311_110092 [Hondaea fermentalgiana]|eukprot:GBG34787.1 Hypothetical Protein FCC1311_110092 [Hondaea fermentalgiana]